MAEPLKIQEWASLMLRGLSPTERAEMAHAELDAIWSAFSAALDCSVGTPIPYPTPAVRAFWIVHEALAAIAPPEDDDA